MRIQDPQWQTAVVATASVAGGTNGSGRVAPLRVDAQRNLEHVLRAAREVFGELGYGAPMEDVARRARVGVGTVYRRFPSKDVLVRRIAEEETSRLTEQAHAALVQEEDEWTALTRFLRYAVGSGAGRLLPPQVLRAGAEAVASPSASVADALGSGPVASVGYMPPQRLDAPVAGMAGAAVAEAPPVRLAVEDSGAAALLEVVGQLVERARGVGKLRPDVTVADVLLVIATAAPSLPDANQQAAASARVLEILLDGLRARVGERTSSPVLAQAMETTSFE
ncbi:TetR/AcrR family transcriptional regulator [Wenjunlia tyrosinilytica]|uniref:TetR family transcriptional regulator n=1 Tax=Wenjunlia tyrosinilytica TaxID=1544741 RepID=A0A917ZLL7_9ACTN|nr:helix-turn-helix domain-containing protein [Wenjunlia tyrosinilytica]GGO85282.1 TetR family transcriptional regulator [Wenjunlia tyrosinilytica]